MHPIFEALGAIDVSVIVVLLSKVLEACVQSVVGVELKGDVDNWVMALIAVAAVATDVSVIPDVGPI